MARLRRGVQGTPRVRSGPARKRGRTFVALGVSMLSIGAMAVAAQPSAAAPPKVSAVLNQFGFPHWYEDNNNTRLEPCLDVTDLHCILIPVPGVYDTQQPLAFPTNFPDEFFYSVVDSDKLTTPGCPGATSPLAANPGKAFTRLALEGAFINGLPAPGDQMAFGRVRIVVRGGLCPNTAYTFTHPYGSTTLTTDADGGIKPVDGTVDIGCRPVAPELCNFALATGSPILSTGFLRWDPSVAPAADPGYLGGDPAVLHPIVGGVSPANNLFNISDGAGFNLGTNLFSVSGKIAGPLVAGSPVTDFGGVVTNTTSQALPVTVTNVGPIALTIGAPSVVGGEFAIVGGGSCGGLLAVDASCTVMVTFTPAVAGVRTGNLIIPHDGLRSPFSVNLQGTGITVGAAPGLAAGPSTLTFDNVRVGTLSTPQTVTVTNTGTAPLQVQDLSFINNGGSTDSTDAAAFRVMFDNCTGIFVPAGASNTCTLQVAFQPLHARPYSADLRVVANTNGGPVTVALSAFGIGGIAAQSTGPDGAGPDGINPANGFPNWYQDESGLRVGQCLDPNDPLCVVLPDPTYDPANGPVVFPTNFPGEFFYYVADSDAIATPGCGAASPPGKAFVRMADEGSFITGAPVADEQIVFGRIRIVVTSGLCPDTAYVFTHPYGQVTITTDGAGGVRRNAATQDIGCFPVAPSTCNFQQALASPVSGGYLVQTSAPGGYLGSPAVLDTVTGSPFIPPDDLTHNANYFRINNADGTLVDQTSLFTVMGKLVGPMIVTPEVVDFGTVDVGTTSTPAQTVTFTNDGIAPATVNTVTLTGTDPTQYVISNNQCIGQLLNPNTSNAGNSSCTVDVAFAPTATGTRTALLTANHTGQNNPLSAHLTGVGGVAGQAAISVTPAAPAFTDLKVGATSVSVSLTLSNVGGTADLKVGSVGGFSNPIIAGAGAASFEYTNNCTAPVAPNTTCTIDVRFVPQADGVQAATLTIPNNSALSPTITIPLSARGFGGLPAQSLTNTASGFPSWFQDANGVRVEPCLAVQDPNCVVLADPGFNPALPLVFTSNFPSEFFYSLADSDIVTIPAGPCGGGGTSAGGTASLRIATEGAFANGVPIAGDQVTFGRVRVVANGLCPNTSYQFIHPFRTETFTTNGLGEIRPNQGTINFNIPAATHPLADGLVRWDPNVAPAAPIGYLGDGHAFHRIVGSNYRPSGPGTEPANYFRVTTDAGAIIAQTDKFAVAGKIAGPVVSDKATLAFGNQTQGVPSGNQTVTVTNIGNTPVSAITSTLSSSTDFQFNGGSCTPATVLQLDQSCTVLVRFNPPLAGAIGAKAATLTIAHNGLRSPITVGLSGTATAPAVAVISVSPTSIAYGNVNLGTTTASVVTVTNTGTAALTFPPINPRVIAGTNANQFAISATTCAGVLAPSASCTISVRFAPTSNGAKTASLVIASSDTARPTVSVALTGTGVAAVMTISPTSLTFSTKGTSTSTVKITNSGTAPLSLVNPIFTLAGTGAAKFTASNTSCTAAVAPGKSCNISVTFNPGAGTTGQVYTATLTINSNAFPATGTVSLTGTRK